MSRNSAHQRKESMELWLAQQKRLGYKIPPKLKKEPPFNREEELPDLYW